MEEDRRSELLMPVVKQAVEVILRTPDLPSMNYQQASPCTHHSTRWVSVGDAPQYDIEIQCHGSNMGEKWS